MNCRYVCLHGHFYQPPRENPWIEEVEAQDSALPFHDWNERIAAECYGPNGAARVKSPSGHITDIVNNYQHLSFNFGSTLLSWLERTSPGQYERVLEADATSQALRGHGNALAQAYNHPILPLCSPRDRLTQIRWGIADFRERFGRDPEGFWLPETAADSATLRDLAHEGIRFTILSPFQATRIRAPGGEWQDATGARFDPTRPYKIVLGDGVQMTVFFYDAPIARAFAFGNGGARGEEIVGALDQGFDASRGHDEVLVVAVDGETFGHHRKGFDEALAQAFQMLRARTDLEIVNLGEVLDRVPVEWEAEIVEGASWSCSHGLDRWKSDCGCSTNGQPGWRQHWRAPLREALDGLRDKLADLFEREGQAFFPEPWAVRDRYVDILRGANADTSAFLERHAGRRLDEAETVRALKLLEMQRHAMLMYTSCGWFFAEISGLETVQILKYAARALQLAHEVTGVDLEPDFKSALERAPSNLEHLGTGAVVWDEYVRPSIVSLEDVAAHYAIASIVEPAGERSSRLWAYPYQIKSGHTRTSGTTTLAVGKLVLESALTHEKLARSFCVLNFSGSDFRCGLRPADDPRQAEMERSLFDKLDSLSQVLHEVDRLFQGRDYTLRDLFLDERRRIAGLLLQESIRRCEREYIDIFEANARLMEFLREIDSPIPRPVRVAADVALTRRLEELTQGLAEDACDRATLHAQLVSIANATDRLGARLDLEALRSTFEKIIAQKCERLAIPGPHRENAALDIIELIELGDRLKLKLDLWSGQNLVWHLFASPNAPQLDPDVLRLLAEKLWFDPDTLLARARHGLTAVTAESDASREVFPAQEQLPAS